MKLNVILVMVSFCLFQACSFKSNENGLVETPQVNGTTNIEEAATYLGKTSNA